MTTNAILKQSGIQRALIVDDGYDEIPRSNDIGEDQWSTFFTDLNGKENTHLESLYPPAKELEDSVLQKDDAFIKKLWKAQSLFRDDVILPLFEAYREQSAQDVETLLELKAILESHGLTVVTSGINFQTKATEADLLVVDMFWGIPQQPSDKEQATVALAKYLKTRPTNHPAVIIMSSNPYIANSRDKFRDKAGIFEAGFGVIKKVDIPKPGRLPRILRELSHSRNDALKLNKFVDAWLKALKSATEATESDIRKIDLHDWAQIDELLLSVEKVSTGSYILDIFDRVLQHEIESNQKVIKTAQALDTLNEEHYPKMATPSSRDTLSILHKTLYQHSSRRRLIPSKGFPVQFGDIIGLKKNTAADLIFKDIENPVFFVMTPACDLMFRSHGMATHVTLVAGSFELLSASISGGSVKPLSTPVLEIDGKTRVKVKWNAANIVSLTMKQISSLIGDDGPGRVLGQLREGPANSLQQQILSKLGRIGTTAPLPSNYEAKIECYYFDTKGDAMRLSLKGHNPIAGVCYVGRSKKGGPKMKVPFDPDAYHELYDELNKLTSDVVGTNSYPLISELLSESVFDQLFSGGLELITSGKKGSAPAKLKLAKGKKDIRVGTVLLNQTMEEGVKANGNKKLLGLVVRVITKNDGLS